MIPLWFKVACTGFLAVLLPAHVSRYGPKDFLWFSDIALIGAGVASWLQSALLASSLRRGVGAGGDVDRLEGREGGAALALSVAVLVPETMWIVSYAGRLVGVRLTTVADYMSDPKISWPMRALSLGLPVVVPAALVYLLLVLGYGPWGLVLMIGLAWIVLPLTYSVTDPKQNIDWVFGSGATRRRSVSPLGHLFLLMIGLPVVVYLPTHFLLRWSF